MRALMGTAVPPPLQLAQTILPLPRHVLHPPSPSLHREHQHSTRPVPPQVSHSRRGSSSAGACTVQGEQGAGCTSERLAHVRHVHSSMRRALLTGGCPLTRPAPYPSQPSTPAAPP
ncbi:hypothetical protein ABPG77_010744 [Micractinium sp. CCAP 211/92]